MGAQNLPTPLSWTEVFYKFFESVHLCLLSNLWSFQQLFLQIYFQPCTHFLFFGISVTQIFIRSCIIVPVTWGSVHLKKIFPPIVYIWQFLLIFFQVHRHVFLIFILLSSSIIFYIGFCIFQLYNFHSYFVFCYFPENFYLFV